MSVIPSCMVVLNLEAIYGNRGVKKDTYNPTLSANFNIMPAPEF